jgi:DNA polymerase-1
MKKKFMIVDGNAILHRAWHALPPMTTKDGVVVNAAYGFVTTFFKALKEFSPEYVAVTFDRKEKTFRHEEFKGYKATRIKQPDELYAQIPLVKKILEAMNIKIFEKAGFEADDVIGTLCEKKQVDRDDVLSIIVTGDMDALQLVDENTEVYTMRKGLSDTVLYNVPAVKEKYGGLTPAQLIDYKGLRGDVSDNIPGVPGVGEKTAIELLQKFDSIENLYHKIKTQKVYPLGIKDRIKKLLIENEEIAIQSKRLATIVRDVPLDFKLKDCLLFAYDKQKLFPIFQDLEFKSLLSRLPDFKFAEKEDSAIQEVRDSAKEESVISGKSSNESVNQVALTGAVSSPKYSFINDAEKFENFFAELKKQKEFVFDTETSGLDFFESKLIGISFCWEEGIAFYVKYLPEFLEKLKPIFEDENIKKIGHNLKFDCKFLRQQNIEVKNIYFDTMIASYLLSSGTRTHKLEDIAFRELGIEMPKITDLIGKGAGQITMDFVDENKVSDYSCSDADCTWRIYPILEKQLRENDLLKLFHDIEMPLVEVLIEMEINGILVDVYYLKELSKKISLRLKKLTTKIHKLAGEEFNISSPLQLKKILFEKLEISTVGIGKTKTGLSTAAEQLEKMRDAHPIISLIEEYRELSKLESTYISALPRLVAKKTGRVHTEFNQTITATGRLSSSTPNLQNIPIRTEIGREIRKAFIARLGYRIISADYSQIELRVVACLAQDKVMMEIFQRDEDIHSVTASKIFNVPLEEVTKEQRSASKEVNFGVLYGMGVHGLASRKKISREEAKDFIDKYFQNFSKVKEYLDNMKELAREKGYVETIFGRKRYLPEINSGVQQVRATAERMAINMPIQGTAADLMKIAMIEVYRELKKISPQSKLILQVHDEILIEVPEDDVDKVAQVVDEKMEKIHKLAVPIKVDTEVGQNWDEMEKIA